MAAATQRGPGDGARGFKEKIHQLPRNPKCPGQLPLLLKRRRMLLNLNGSPSCDEGPLDLQHLTARKVLVGRNLNPSNSERIRRVLVEHTTDEF